MIGHKVVPSRRGGIERVLTIMCPLMIKKGHQVTCFNRSGDKVENEYVETVKRKKYRGVQLKKVITINKRGLAAMTSSFSAAICAAFGKYDIVHFHAEGPSAFLWIPKLFGKRCIVTIHGIDWARDKWKHGFGSRYIKFGEYIAAKYADEVIVLSEKVQKYFKKFYDRDTVLIPNGVMTHENQKADLITQKFGLHKDEYICALSRLTEEKGIHFLIEAYKELKTDKSDYDDEILSLGGKVYYAPRLYPQNYPAYFKYMKKFFAEHPEYQIVHSHIDSMSYLPLLAAKKAGVPIRIAHSHNTSIDKDFKYILKQYFRKKVTKAANYYCACGQEAGEFLFPGKEFTFIPNAIEVDKFLYNEEVRDRKRKDLGLTSEFVVGHVGRLSYQKNHELLIRIFNELHKKDANTILLLIGVGEKENEIRKQVHELKLDECVKFLGNRDDVNELYQAMDVFVMPSLFEGIPVVGVEAQFAGLPCVFSDKVPVEVKFSSKTQFVGLNSRLEDWIRAIGKYKGTEKNIAAEDLENSQYDIKKAYAILQNYYLDMASKKGL